MSTLQDKSHMHFVSNYNNCYITITNVEMDYVFACEIEDPVHSTLNLKKHGGETGGCEGNAILSRFPFKEVKGLVIPCGRSKYLLNRIGSVV
jgi:hypothetical protein